MRRCVALCQALLLVLVTATCDANGAMNIGSADNVDTDHAATQRIAAQSRHGGSDATAKKDNKKSKEGNRDETALRDERESGDAVPGPYGQNAAAYRLTFSEEFDRLDTQRWNDHIWYEDSNPTINYATEHGMLKIWPQRDDAGKFFNRTLDTDRHFYQQYGYFEMEAKLPRGKGTWPAFWLFAHPGERRPEIDIMEAYPGGIAPWGFNGTDGVARPNSYAVTIWTDKDIKGGEHKHDAHADLSTGFHKYAVKWEPDRQTFYFDGKPIYSTRVYMPDPMYILVDLWFGSASGEPGDDTPEGKANSFQINYVRAWQFR